MSRILYLICRLVFCFGWWWCCCCCPCSSRDFRLFSGWVFFYVVLFHCCSCEKLGEKLGSAVCPCEQGRRRLFLQFWIERFWLTSLLCLQEFSFLLAETPHCRSSEQRLNTGFRGCSIWSKRFGMHFKEGGVHCCRTFTVDYSQIGRVWKARLIMLNMLKFEMISCVVEEF